MPQSFLNRLREWFSPLEKIVPPNPDGTCDILIPAFCHPDLLRDLLRSLSRNTNRSLLSSIWIGDDGSDAYSRSRFQELARDSGLPVTVVRYDANLGFGENCNRLFALGRSPYCIVLNTDTVVPPLWLERILQPFREHADVALATPLSTDAANLTVRLRPGQTWREADRLLAERTPSFPDACTAVGFCMAVDRKKVETLGMLFDPAFGRGYGEDTDLHYRARKHGYRSVIVDHLFVRHIGAGSFSSVQNAADLQKKGMTLFRERWGATHDKAMEAYTTANALDAVLDSKTGACRLAQEQRHLDVLFVVPSTNLKYGGVWVLCKLIEAFVACGLDVQAVLEDPERTGSDTSPFGFEPYRSPEECMSSLRTVGCVVASSHDTLSYSERLAAHFSCPRALFLQGMEVAFATGANDDTLQRYKCFTHVVAVSECLEEYITFISPTAKVTRAPVGPDPDVFYPRDVQRVPRSVAIAINVNAEKGSVHALQIALFLRDRGFSITFFGWHPGVIDIPPNLGTVMQETDRDSLANLFSRTEFFVDCSRIEGLGLLPLEAAFCGCIPILDVRGGPEYIFTDRRNCIMIPGYKGLGRIIDDIAEFTEREKSWLRTNAQKLRTRLTLQKGLRTAALSIAALAGKTCDKTCKRNAYVLPTGYSSKPS